MSQNITPLLAVKVAGYKVHAVPGSAKPEGLRNITYTRPICGIRGRDSGGFPSAQLIVSDGGFQAFSEATKDVCEKCVRFAKRLADGETLAELHRVRPPEINAATRSAIDATQGTPLSLALAKNITTTNHIVGVTTQSVVAVVESAPYEEVTEYSYEYQANVTYPAKPVRVYLTVTDKDGERNIDAVVSLDYFHPKTMKPITGVKLQRQGRRETGAEIDLLREMVGI